MTMGTTDELINWINKELLQRGWSIRELDRRSGISHATISRVLTGQRNPGVDFCKGMAKAFKTSPVVVLAKAGIIPPLDDEDPSFRELWHHVRQLSYRDRARLIQIASEWSKEKEEDTEELEE